jgi:polyisoprenyl-phosphate glycosyltransferase
MPLRLVAWVGFATLLLDFALGVQTLWNWWRGEAVTGFTTVILVLLGLGGLILLSIGVVALYLAQMYDEQKSRRYTSFESREDPPISSTANQVWVLPLQDAA